MTQKQPGKIVRLDDFRKVTSPLMLREPTGLTPEMKAEMYHGMLTAFRGIYRPQWRNIAFQLGMHAYRPEYPLHPITFEVFGGDYKAFPKLVMKDDINEVLSIPYGFHGFLQQTINLLPNGQVVLRHPLTRQTGPVSNADGDFAQTIRYYNIPNTLTPRP